MLSAHRSTGADSGMSQREAGRGFLGTGKVDDLKKKRKKHQMAGRNAVCMKLWKRKKKSRCFVVVIETGFLCAPWMS